MIIKQPSIKNLFVQCCIAFFMFICVIQIHAQDRNSGKLRILLITGQGNGNPDHPYHTWKHPYHNEILLDALKNIASVTVSEDLSILTSENLKNYDMILNNSLFQSPDGKQTAAFYRFIEEGKTYFCLHAGIVSFLNSEKYAKMLGATFINHVDIKTFIVNPYDNWYGWDNAKKSRNPITKGLEDFKILDELYLCQMNTDDLEVIARAEYHPIMWTRKWGKGRIMCLNLGHSDFSMNNPGFKSLLVNGITWLAQN